MMKKLLLGVALMATTFGFSQTGPTAAWVTMPADDAVLTIGDALPLSATYDAGDDGAEPLVEYTVGGTGSAHLQYSISEKTGGSYVWKAGSNDATTGGTHSGTSTKAWTVPSLTLSADLPDGTTHVLRVGFQNSQNAWASGAAEIPITIVAGAALDAYSFSPVTPTFTSSSTTLDVNIVYTSVDDIAAGGIKFTMWTITDGVYNFPSDDPDEGDVNMFSDIWYGAFSNTSILPGGTDVSATITITIPSGVKNGSGDMRPSTDLGAIWDPNAGDAGNNYVDHATSPAPQYYYQFRQVAGTDANFVPSYSSTSFTVEAAAGLEDLNFQNITVYPNPTTGIINISDVSDINTISITNIAGQVVAQFGSQNSIDISNLATGVYILQADNGLKRKIVKK